MDTNDDFHLHGDAAKAVQEAGYAAFYALVSAAKKAGRVDVARAGSAAGFRAIRKALWHVGDRDAGVPPTAFETALFVTIDEADDADRVRLSAGFPDMVRALVAARDSDFGRPMLRARVQAAGLTS